jgi:HEPN domain-containing protein
MPGHSRDWLKQAEHDLEQARASQRDGRHEWACLAALHAAENAAKAMHLANGQEASEHVVATLLAQLPQRAPAALIEKARVLDKVTTRQHHGIFQSQQAIDYAAEIVQYARTEVG